MLHDGSSVFWLTVSLNLNQKKSTTRNPSEQLNPSLHGFGVQQSAKSTKTGVLVQDAGVRPAAEESLRGRHLPWAHTGLEAWRKFPFTSTAPNEDIGGCPSIT